MGLEMGVDVHSARWIPLTAMGIVCVELLIGCVRLRYAYVVPGAMVVAGVHGVFFAAVYLAVGGVVSTVAVLRRMGCEGFALETETRHREGRGNGDGGGGGGGRAM